MITRWLLGFFDTNADSKLTFADVSILVALGIFTIKMLGWLPGASDDPHLWTIYIGATCSMAGLIKLTDVFK